MRYVEFWAPSRIKTNLMKQVLNMGNSGKGYSTVLSRAHLWCVSLVMGCGVYLCVCHFGCGDCQLWELDEAVVVCGCTTEGLGLHCVNTSRVLAHYSPEYWCTAPENWQSAPRVLPQYCQGTGAVLPEYRHITPESLPQYYQSTGTVL